MSPISVAAVALFGVALVGCGPSEKLHHSQVLGTVTNGSIIVETWHEKTFMSLPTWRVFRQESASTNRQFLFAVEKEFQESIPGYPMLVVTNGTGVVRDESGSYVFSLESRDFITNAYTGRLSW